MTGQATPPAGLTGVVAIAAGADHSLSLKGDGTVVGWGRNYEGQATPPAGLSGVVATAAGAYHSLALKSGGTVVAWGDDSYGQATPAAGLSEVVAIAGGYYHSLALRSDGTVVGWGRNYEGQATPPAELSGVAAISAGFYHSLALTSEGTVVGWGENDNGEATPPAGLAGVVAIEAGLRYSLALIESPPACLVDIGLSYSAGALSITQTIGSTAARNVYQSALFTVFGVRQLVGPRIVPAMDPPRSFSSSISMGGIGTVGVLGLLHSFDDALVCYDFETVNPGGSGPSVEEIKEMVRRSGLAPQGF